MRIADLVSERLRRPENGCRDGCNHAPCGYRGGRKILHDQSNLRRLIQHEGEPLVMVLTIPGELSKIRRLIEKRYRDDKTFREVFDDYLEYRNAYRFWKKSRSDEAPLRQSEYAELVIELEKELTQILKRQAPTKTDDLNGRKLE